MKVLGVIIAGGKSSRMGQDKALIAWRGKTLIEHVAARFAPQVDQLLINANGDPSRFGFLALKVIADTSKMGTPLAGLQAALQFAQDNGFDAVVTATCDSPLLPADLRERLQGEGSAIAASAGQAHYLTGFWPVVTLAFFETHSFRRVQDFAAVVQAQQVEWQVDGYDPFINLNTPEDLAALSEKL